MNENDLTPLQQAMVAAWDRHTSAEFVDSDVEATMATMTDNPYVYNVAVMAGGFGAENVRAFYSRHFLPGNPKDTEGKLVARTVGANRIVDELIHCVTHDIEMPWILPGIPPTGKRVEVSLVEVVEFEGEKIAGERIYWDQASVLAQVGVLDSTALPVVGIEAARKNLATKSNPPAELLEPRVSKPRSAAA